MDPLSGVTRSRIVRGDAACSRRGPAAADDLPRARNDEHGERIRSPATRLRPGLQPFAAQKRRRGFSASRSQSPSKLTDVASLPSRATKATPIAVGLELLADRLDEGQALGISIR